jgi:hypothetical protein
VGDSLIAKSGQLGSFRYGVASLVAGTIVMMVAPRIHDTIPIYIGYPFGGPGNRSGRVPRHQHPLSEMPRANHLGRVA